MEATPAQSAAPQTAGSSEQLKARLKKPVKPDVEEHKAVVDQLQQELGKRRTKMEELKNLIDQKRLSGGGPEVSKARATLNDISSRFRAELDTKKALREELQAVNKQRDSLRAKLREVKARVGSYSTVQKIEEKIASLDYRITHHTLDLKEENRTREEMKKLAGLKSVVGVYAQEEENLKGTDNTRQQLLDRLKACDDKLSAIKSEEEKQWANMKELRGREAAGSQDIPALAKERDECREVMNALWQKIKELREEHRARHNKFWEEHQAWQKQQQEERRLKQIAKEAEYAEREEARKAAAAEFAGEPYHKEIGLCEQLISHLGKYRQQGEAAAPVAAPATSGTSTEEFQGMKAVKKKGEGDPEEGFGAFYGTGSKKGKGKKAKAPSASQSSPSDQKLNHSLDIIDAFSKLKVTMPLTAGKVPDALKEVEARKAYYLKKRTEAKENGNVVAEEEADAASSSKSGAAKATVAKPSANGVLNFSAEEWPDFSGNVNKGSVDAADTAKPGPPAGSSGEAVSVQLGVEGDRVSLQFTPSS